MKKYFISTNGENDGPFTLEELQLKNLTKSTLIWTEELGNWTEISKVAELKATIKISPPPVPNKTEITIAKETKFIYKQFIYGIIIGILSIAVHYFIIYKLYTNPTEEAILDYSDGEMNHFRYIYQIKEFHDFYLKKMFYNSFYIFLGTTMTLIIYKYITTSVKWVKQNSTK